MQDYAAARRTMVDCQVRTFDVTDLSVIAAFDVTPREIYAPAGREAMAYADVAIPLDGAPGRVMLPPLVLARMLQSFGPLDGLKVLEIGAGTGYGSALLARLGAKVTALESDDGLAAAAKINLERDGVAGVQVVTGALANGYAANAPYDAILLNGGYEVLPDALLQQLADGGALVAIEVSGAASRIVIQRRASGVNSRAVIVNAWAPVLDGFARKPEFTF
ncbi:protein-L-isoaspartate O-methyltransferase family protein [Camelimonas lactis]|uniref:Protein-L-isoaspartate O-methyltransferase n=1 Tax=Camelimonas lactis TaxID=659006 RepID=A0A4R2GW42_9HYPH|nr:protein-L-isoaspartate O-methyltransferase [Camelimonas lactis]TCO15036.1 protein-L-isoaspartate(D-aspartate) O-methyltransferase [Camelimonas lactis]